MYSAGLLRPQSLPRVSSVSISIHSKRYPQPYSIWTHATGRCRLLLQARPFVDRVLDSGYFRSFSPCPSIWSKSRVGTPCNDHAIVQFISDFFIIARLPAPSSSSTMPIYRFSVCFPRLNCSPPIPRGPVSFRYVPYPQSSPNLYSRGASYDDDLPSLIPIQDHRLSRLSKPSAIQVSGAGSPDRT